jgi:hypothetical protein
MTSREGTALTAFIYQVIAATAAFGTTSQDPHNGEWRAILKDSFKQRSFEVPRGYQCHFR